ncbi:hypothetical protein Anas_05876 [Armadillidium nasatum]|uniref:Rho-GAP domain-containing protein n=1 Tax=Armadillidium nasatum TaxID=96803 RepID=A0A5N5TAR2_9CRUS|nr:hypothetical protein Anas_05876 [Armadillidium nasatum]
MVILKYISLILALFVARLSCQASKGDLISKMEINKLLEGFKLIPDGEFSTSKISVRNLNGSGVDVQNVNQFCSRSCRLTNGDIVNPAITTLEIGQFNKQHLSGTGSPLQNVNESCAKYCQGSWKKDFGQNSSAKKLKTSGKNKALHDKDLKFCDKNKALDDKDYKPREEKIFYKSRQLKSLEKELIQPPQVNILSSNEKGTVGVVQLELTKPPMTFNLNFRLRNKKSRVPEISITESDADLPKNVKVSIDPILIPNLNARKFFSLLRMDSPSFADITHLALKSLSNNVANPKMLAALNITCEKIKILIDRDMKLNKLPMVFIKNFHPVIEKYLVPKLNILLVKKIIKLLDESFKLPRVFSYLKEVTEVPKDLTKKDLTMSNLAKVISKFLKKLVVRNSLQNRVLKKFYRRSLRRLIEIVKKDIEHNQVPINTLKFALDTFISGSRFWESKNLEKLVDRSKPKRNKTYKNFTEFLDTVKTSKELKKTKKVLNHKAIKGVLNDCRRASSLKEKAFCKRFADLTIML